MKKYNISKWLYCGRFILGVEISGPRHYSNGGAVSWQEWHKISFTDRDGDILIYDNGDGRERRATLQLAPWARHLHGNAPGGTYYGRYIVTLSNGTRVSIPQYI